MNGFSLPPAVKYLTREMDDLAREFYRRLGDDGVLATTRCDRCDQSSFPPRARCVHCGSSQRWVPLPESGRLYAFTTQERALRFQAPWVLALAEFGDVVVPGVVDQRYEALSIGQAVTAAGKQEPDTGLTLVRFKPL